MNKFRNRLAALGLILGICLLLPNGAQALESGRADAVLHKAMGKLPQHISGVETRLRRGASIHRSV
jgi:hypothetical protein